MVDRQGHIPKRVDLGRPLDERDHDPPAGIEGLGRALGQLGAGRGEVGDPQPDAREGAPLAGSFAVEERQFPAAGVAAHQREVALLRDHVHADVPFQEGDDGLAVGDPEGDVVEGLRLHEAAKDIDATIGAET